MSETSISASTASLEVLNPAKSGIRVEFRWTGDRYSHTLFGLSRGQVEPLLESKEGHLEAPFPTSPPFLELHQQGETLFLTGANDVGHWSMSVALASTSQLSTLAMPTIFSDAEEFGDDFLLFDVAGRLRVGAGTVGSEYQGAGPNVHGEQADHGAFATISAGQTRGTMLVGPTSQQQPLACQVVYEGERAGTGKLRISPAAENPKKFPATVRWQYGIFWALG